MIDGIKLTISNDILKNNLENNPLLQDEIQRIKTKTGEFQAESFYRGFKFTIYCSGRIEILGSIHKYFNGGAHNYNDFGLSNIKAVLVDLAAKFGAQILESKIENLELGLNISTPDKASDFIKRRNIILLKSGPCLKHPIVANDSKGFDKGIKYVMAECWLKMYNKGVQCQVGEHLLRCEYKAIKMRVIKETGIQYLADVAEPEKLASLFAKLIELYDRVLIREDFNEGAMSEYERDLILKIHNPDYWTDRVKVSRMTRLRKRAQLERLVTKYATSNIKAEIRNLLFDKYQKLIAS